MASFWPKPEGALFNIPFFSGQRIAILRYGNQKVINGLVSSAPRWEFIAGQVQPSSDLRNIKSKYGEHVSAAIYVTTPKNFPLSVTKAGGSGGYIGGDVILFRGQFWKIETSIPYDRLIPHHEATATLIDHPPKELSKFLPGGILTQSGKNLTSQDGRPYALE